jgi:nitroreductase
MKETGSIPRRYVMINLLRTRRSIRRYGRKPVEAEPLEILKEALLRSPSSRGFNPWTFIFVDKPDVLEQLSVAKEHGSAFLKGAALGIVVCGDETVSDVWVEDCSIASVVAHLTAHSLGLGSCWIQIRNRLRSGEQTAEQYIQALLGIPAHVRVEAIISIGDPAEAKSPVPKDKLDYGKIRHNRY